MSSEKDALEFAAQVSPEEAADYLESLARSLREGAILLESGDSSMTLEVSRSIQFELQASASPEKGKRSLELGLSWRAAEQVKPQPTLAIVAGPAAVASLAEAD
jgi:amphi-Trp domain-containing protein